jgi:hypothetical protein
MLLVRKKVPPRFVGHHYRVPHNRDREKIVEFIWRFWREGIKLTPALGNCRTVAEFIDLWLGVKVNSGIGLSYRHARLHGWRAGTTTLCRSWLYPPVRYLWIPQLAARLQRLAGRYDNPMPESTISPIQGTWIWLQIIIWIIRAMDRASAQPQANLSFCEAILWNSNLCSSVS